MRLLNLLSLIQNSTYQVNFLTRWIQSSGEKPMTEQEAKIEYEKSEKGLRFSIN